MIYKASHGKLSAEIFMLNNKTYLCIVDYHSKFQVVKLTDCLHADILIKILRLFEEYRLLRKIMSHAGTNLVSEKF